MGSRPSCATASYGEGNSLLEFGASTTAAPEPTLRTESNPESKLKTRNHPEATLRTGKSEIKNQISEFTPPLVLTPLKLPRQRRIVTYLLQKQLTRTRIALKRVTSVHDRRDHIDLVEFVWSNVDRV